MSSMDAVWFHGTDETFNEWVFPPPEKPGNEGVVVAHSAVYLTTHEGFARAAGGKLCSAQLQPFAKTLDTAEDSKALESLRLAVRQNKLASLCAWTGSAGVWEKAWRNGDVLRVAYGTVEAQYFIESTVASQAQQLQESDDAGYRKHALTAQDQITGLAESLYPTAWREGGLPSALQEGAVAHALRAGGMHYRCDFRGPIGQLPQSLRVAIYRSTNEAIADVCSRQHASDIFVQVRCGVRHGRRWSVASVSVHAHPVRMKHIVWNDVIPKVVRATSSLGWPAIQDRAATFEGRARERMTQRGRRITMSFQEPQKPDDH